jgi:hypothetical protein
VLRARLRKAEDFEIKYELVLKQNQALSAENQQLLLELREGQACLDGLRSERKGDFSEKNELLNSVNYLSKELELWKRKHSDLENHTRRELEFELSKDQSSELRRRLDSQQDAHRSEVQALHDRCASLEAALATATANVNIGTANSGGSGTARQPFS